jgi:hypothetical protein
MSACLPACLSATHRVVMSWWCQHREIVDVAAGSSRCLCGTGLCLSACQQGRQLKIPGLLPRAGKYQGLQGKRWLVIACENKVRVNIRCDRQAH